METKSNVKFENVAKIQTNTSSTKKTVSTASKSGHKFATKSSANAKSSTNAKSAVPFSHNFGNDVAGDFEKSKKAINELADIYSDLAK